MSISQIEKLEKERTALLKKIAHERSKLAAKIGTELMKAFGEEDALTLSEKLAETVKATSPEATLQRLRDCLNNPGRGGRQNGADAPSGDGVPS